MEEEEKPVIASEHPQGEATQSRIAEDIPRKSEIASGVAQEGEIAMTNDAPVIAPRYAATDESGYSGTLTGEATSASEGDDAATTNIESEASVIASGSEATPTGEEAAAPADAEGEATPPNEAAVPAIAEEATPPAKGKSKRKKRAKKPPKMVSAKKLPGLLKKKYKVKALEKKLLKHIYVPADKEYVKSLFTEETITKGKKTVTRMRIDRAMMIESRQVKRLKKIAKDVKAQKAGFKVAPFAAVVVLVFAATTVVTAFKNVVTKKLVVAGMQKVFNAKCDIAYLDLSIFGARLEIRGLQQANKNDVMKNIFEVGDIIFDFDLTEALRGKLDVQNITVGSIALGTDRKTSGYLPPKVKTPEEIAKEEEAARKTAARKAKLIQSTKNTLNNMFSDYDPRNIIASVQEGLKSPGMARQTQEMVETMIDKWKDTPAEMEKSVMDFSHSVEAVVRTNWGGIDDAQKLQDAITTVDASIKQGKALKEDTEKTIREFVTDSKAAVQLSKDIAEAIKSDTQLIDKELDKFRDLKDRGIKGVFNDMLTAFIYGMADQYSPYIRVVLDYVGKIRKEAAANAAKKEAVLGSQPKKQKKVVKRAKGRTIYWKDDRVPKILIEKVYGSGPNWMIDAREISSDADKRGRPAIVKSNFTIGPVGSDISAVIDARKSSKAPLVQADYIGTGVPTSVVIDSYGMKSQSVIKAAISGGSGGKFSASGSIDMSNVQILTPSFEPEIVYNIYLEAINSFTAMSMGFDAVYSQDDGFEISLNTDIGDRLQEIFMATLRRETEKVVAYAKEQAVALLSDKTGGATDRIAEFMGIDNLMEIQKVNVDELNNKLEGIKDEIKARLEATARAAAEEGIKQLNSKIEESIKDSGADKYLKALTPPAGGGQNWGAGAWGGAGGNNAGASGTSGESGTEGADNAGSTEGESNTEGTGNTDNTESNKPKQPSLQDLFKRRG